MSLARACANPCKVLSIVAIGASHAPGPGGADQADLSTALANAGPAMRGERCNLWVLALIQVRLSRELLLRHLPRRCFG